MLPETRYARSGQIRPDANGVLPKLAPGETTRVSKLLSPTEVEQQMKIRAAGRALVGGGEFNKLDTDNKNIWYERFKLTDKLPPFAFRDAESRNAFTKGYAEYLRNTGDTAADATAAKALNRAQTMAMGDIKKREQLQETFISKIEQNVKTLETAKKKYGGEYNRLANIPINKLNEYLGSGDLASLKLVLRSISNEVAKVESGSLGIAEVSVTQAEAMNKIHDANMTLGDLMTVANMSLELGHNARNAIKSQLSDLQTEMKSKPGIKVVNDTKSEQKPRNVKPAVTYLKASPSREEAIRRIKSLSEKGWTKEELTTIAKDSGWE
jgi:hypothetical protein